MELWVRSQNKNHLINIKEVYITEFEDDFEIRTSTQQYIVWLGRYKTKERALEVLDIIQKLLLYSSATNGQLRDAFKDCKKLPKISVNSKGVAIYEMPEE